MKRIATFSIGLLVSLFIVACEKEVNVELPPSEQKPVVEGRVEQGRRPFVILTNTTGFFEPTDRETIEASFIHDAKITIDDGSQKVNLQEICSETVPDSLLPVIEDMAGVPAESLKELNFCVYTSFSMRGRAGRSYHLEAHIPDGATLRSQTYIPHPVALDSVWFKPFGNMDTLGFAWALLNDPDTLGNAYRWFTKRLSHYPNGEQKDRTFKAPLGSAIYDEFFNGKAFEFNYNRPAEGEEEIAENPYESKEERRFFRRSDTIAVKFTSITMEVRAFFRSFEEAQANTGSPFASPSDIESNVEGGLGIFAGYGVTHDTIHGK